MLIDKFTFQTDFLFYKKHTKCSLNFRSLDFASADSSREEKAVKNSSRANLSLDLLYFFLQNDSLVFSSTSTFHLCISSVYFTVRRVDLLNLPKFYRASSFLKTVYFIGEWINGTFCCMRSALLQMSAFLNPKL